MNVTYCRVLYVQLWLLSWLVAVVVVVGGGGGGGVVMMVVMMMMMMVVLARAGAGCAFFNN